MLRQIMLFAASVITLAVPMAAPKAVAGCFVPGDYNAQTPASYNCCLNFVNFSITSWTFEDLGGGSIRVTGHSGTLPALNGTLNCANGTFSASGSILGGCTENYSLVGQFVSPGHWTGTFAVNFTGSQCSCSGLGNPCQNRQWSVIGTTTQLSVPVGNIPGLSLTCGPNPFRRSIGIDLELERSTWVVSEVLDLGGRVIEVLCDQSLGAGAHRLDWNRTTRAGARARSGLYFLRLEAGGKSRMVKLVALD